MSNSFRVLEQEYKQADLFFLWEKSAAALSEKLPTMQQLMAFTDIQGLYYIHNAWPSRYYAVYSRNMEQPLGSSITWKSTIGSVVFEVPNIPHPIDPQKRLRDTCNEFFLWDIRQLVFDAKTLTVRPKTEYLDNPDLKVIRMAEDHTYFFVPDLESKTVLGSGVASLVCPENFTPGSTGWHGCVVLNTLDILHEAGDPLRQDVEMLHDWSENLSVVLVQND